MKRRAGTDRRIRAGLTGPNAKLGRVAAADVARFLLGLERAAARAALALLGKPGSVGRRGRAIEDAVRLRLHSITQGSVIAELEVPEFELEEPRLELEDKTLGEMAIEKTLETARAHEGADPGVAEALVALLGELAIGDRYESIWVQRMGRARSRIVIDRESGARLRDLASRPTTGPREDRLVGTLVEADFEKRTARLRLPEGKAVAVRFSEVLDDDIQGALRHPAELEGRVSFDPVTTTATSVELRRVQRADQLDFWREHAWFWQQPTMEDLRRQQGVEPISDVAVLRDESATSGEIDAFLAALRK